MKFNKILTLILIIFLKTGNVLSEESIFNVNNIEINNRENISIENLTKKAIKKDYPFKSNRNLIIDSFISKILKKKNNYFVSFSEINILMSICFSAIESLKKKKLIKINY